MAAALAAVLLAACGGDSSDSDGEAAGENRDYRVEVVDASFPTRQRLGETALLRIAVRNEGERTVPGLLVTVSLAGEGGEGSSLPFAIRSAEPGLAQPDRPVWVLAEKYPKRAGSGESAGAEISSRKSFDFGPLEAGEEIDAVWKLTASRSGEFRLVYRIGGDLAGDVRPVNAAGVEPGGSFEVRIAAPPPETVVTDDGEVVEVPRRRQTDINR